jgi:hypothetical protein
MGSQTVGPVSTSIEDLATADCVVPLGISAAVGEKPACSSVGYVFA